MASQIVEYYLDFESSNVCAGELLVETDVRSSPFLENLKGDLQIIGAFNFPRASKAMTVSSIWSNAWS
jgi:hypothetical protein